MKLNTTSERDLEIVVDDHLNYIIAIEQLVILSDRFGFEKGFESVIIPLILMFDDETDDQKIEDIKNLIAEFLNTISDLEKQYYLDKNKNIIGDTSYE